MIVFIQMKQTFGYRPPSAGRSLIRNSDVADDEIEPDSTLEEDNIEEQIFNLKLLIKEILAARYKN